MDRCHGQSGENTWRTGAGYQPLLTTDRRHWAWLWLKRNQNYQEAAARVAETAKWISKGSDKCCLMHDDLTSLFLTGYLYIPVVAAIAIGMPGFFGARTWIRPLSSLKPNQYPRRTSMLSISPGFPSRRI